MLPFPSQPRWLLLVVLLVLALDPRLLRAEDKPLRQLIDAEIQAAWQREKLTPSGRADDATFLRRIYLDLAGTIPTHDEAAAFLQDAEPKKREKLIDKLLEDPRFAGHQADVWDLILFGRNPSNGDATRNREVFKKWLIEKFAKNEPYDRWVRELLLAEQEGTPLFYVQFRNQPEEATVAVSRLFLGMQLQCARCHDHPFESWTQRDFYGMAGFFARLVFLEAGGDANRRKYVVGEKSTGDVLFTGPVKDQKPGQKGEPVKPKFLGGALLEEPPLPKDFKEPDLKGAKSLPKPVFSRKDKLAEWVVAADNPYFAKAAANRVWKQFLGRGLVDPVDNLSPASPPSHPELLQALAERMAAGKFDFKSFIRALVNSEAYQLSEKGESSAAALRWYERARVRPLSAEELLASIRTATGFDLAARAAGAKPGEEKLPSDFQNYFVRYFGEPMNGRGDFQGSLTEHLFLNNSTSLRQMIQSKKGNLAESILSAKSPWEERVDRLFLSVLTRLPRPEEKKKFVDYLNSGPKPESLVEEAIWVLLNCAEFRFNH